MTEDVVAEFRRLLQQAFDAGPAEPIKDAERRLADVRTVESRLKRLLLDPALGDDTELSSRLIETRHQAREIEANLARLRAAAGTLDRSVLERQLSVHPAELLGPVLKAPPDAAHLNAVLRRLITRFAFVGRPRRGTAVFELDVSLGNAIAENTKSTTVVRQPLRFRVEVSGGYTRPLVWTVKGRRL